MNVAGEQVATQHENHPVEGDSGQVVASHFDGVFAPQSEPKFGDGTAVGVQTANLNGVNHLVEMGVRQKKYQRSVLFSVGCWRDQPFGWLEACHFGGVNNLESFVQAFDLGDQLGVDFVGR